MRRVGEEEEVMEDVVWGGGRGRGVGEVEDD